MRAIPLLAPLRVDGRLDEPVYETVPPVSDFIQQLARRGRPRHRAHRGVGDVRRRELLRRGPLLGQRAAERVDGDGDAPRRVQHAEQRPVRLPHRHVLRPAQRPALLRQPRRGVRRPGDHQRGQSEPRLEPGVGRADGALRRRLDHRDGGAVQVAALPARARPGVGHPDTPHRDPQERVGVPDPDPHLRRGVRGAGRRVPRVGGGHPGRAGGPARRHPPGDQALRHRRRHHRRQRAGRPGGPPRRDRRRPQVRRHPEPDRRLHRQHRLRPGRGGRAAGEPDPLQPVLPREARVLPGGARHLRLRAGELPDRPHPAAGQRARAGALRRPCSTAAASGWRAARWCRSSAADASPARSARSTWGR